MSFGQDLRRRNIERLGAEEFDLVVIGGGITGAGVALDSAGRGLRTALVERADFSSGTSSRSSKIVHGGLRYLQQREIRLVYEALSERQRLLRLAPHLVHPLPHLLPVLGPSKTKAVVKLRTRAISSALWMYDLTGAARIGKLHRKLSAAKTLERAPWLNPEQVAGGFIYYDARADDARLTLELVKTAALDHGAVVANYVEVTGIGHSGAGGYIERVEVRDRLSGTEHAIKSGVVVNASGVWVDEVRSMDESSHPRALRPAKGVHISLPRSKLPADLAVVLPVPGDKRSIFIVPWNDHVYVGTTDTDYDGPLDDPLCTDEDVAYLLRAVNAWVRDPIVASDVTGTWAGLRPLLSDTNDTRTADLSRRHSVDVSPHGLVSVTGGKLTTYRRMAADAVDAAIGVLAARAETTRAETTRAETTPSSERVFRRSSGRLRCRTARLPIRGAERDSAIELLVDEDPDLGGTLVPGLPYLRAEAVYAAREEMAMTLDDVLARRTRSLLMDRGATLAASEPTASLLARELGWDEAETQRQVDAFSKVA